MPGRSRVGRPERLGQHFLGNEQIARRIVADAGVGRDDRVVDLGAGTGLLTAALAARSAAVLAVEIDDALASGLVRRFAAAPNVIVVRADATDVPLPANAYRVVANPPFGHTSAILHRLLDDPGGGLVRADLVVQWQVARQRARVSDGGPADLSGTTWAPWWRFARGRRLPAPLFRPRPGVDAAVLTITRHDPPALAAADFPGWARFVRRLFETRPDAPELGTAECLRRFRARR